MRLVKFTRDDTETVWINPEMVTRVEPGPTQKSTMIYLHGGQIIYARESLQVVIEALTNIVRI